MDAVTSGRATTLQRVPTELRRDVSAPMDLNQLRADDLRLLLVVARSGTISSAASALALDPTTVSRRLKSLETALGARMLERGADGWELTQLGQIVAQRATPIEALIRDVADAVEVDGEKAGTLRGTMRIVSTEIFGALFVAPALARIRTAHPDLDFELITATRSLALHQSGFDLAVAVGSPLKNHRLVTEELTDYTFGLYGSQAYFDAHGEPEVLQDLRGRGLIYYVSSLSQVQELELRGSLQTMRSAISTTSVQAQLEATRAGAGLGLLPNYYAQTFPDIHRVLPDEVSMRRSLILAAREASLAQPAVGLVRAALHRETRDRRWELLPEDVSE
jgi:DNA-binding transcriptional LysR family regulator